MSEAPPFQWAEGDGVWGPRAGGSHARAAGLTLRAFYWSATRDGPRGYRATVSPASLTSKALFPTEAEARACAERMARRWLLRALSALGALGPALAALEAAEGYAEPDGDSGPEDDPRARSLRALIDAARSSLDSSATGAPGLASATPKRGAE